MSWPTLPLYGPPGFAVGAWFAAPIVVPKTLMVGKLPFLPSSLTWRVFLGCSVMVLSMTPTASSASPSPSSSSSSSSCSSSWLREKSRGRTTTTPLRVIVPELIRCLPFASPLTICSLNGAPMEAGTVNVSVYLLGGPVVRRYCLGPKINWSGAVWESTWRAQRRPKPKRVRTEAEKIRCEGNDTWKPRGLLWCAGPDPQWRETIRAELKFTLINQMHSAYKREHDGSQTKVYDNPFSDKANTPAILRPSGVTFCEANAKKIKPR